MSLPDHVRADVRRILDREARRLLADQLDRDAAGPAAGSNVRPLDHGADQRPASVEAELGPVLGRDRDGGARAA